MAKRVLKSNGSAKRRVIRRGSSSSAKKVAASTVAKSTKKKNILTWLVTPAVPREKGIRKIYPKHIFKIVTSKKALKLYAIAFLTGFLAVAAVFAWFAKDLPSPNKINSVASAQTTKLYDRTGEHLLVEIYGDKNRSIIEFNQMPQCIKDSTVALEDKNFYNESAFSPQGIGRAVFGVLTRNSAAGGGSTITQQYVKNALLTNERSYTRKIKELILAIEIEQLYKKDDILKLYLNEIPYGSTAYGVQAASKQFFGVDAKDLTLPQCAMLASLPQAPTYYSPYGLHTAELMTKKNRVLDLMAQQKKISQADADAAKQVDVMAQLKPYNPYANVTAPHFVQYVRDYLEEKYGVKAVEQGGLKVITTLDLDKQKMAEDAIAKNMKAVRGSGGSNAALVSEDPQTGQMLAMVGSYNYADPNFGSFNVADAPRQPGSSFKPIVYANLMKGNYGAGTTFYDVKTDFGGGYTPKNYSGRNYGVQSLRTALDGSLNIPAVKALYMGGVDNALKTAKEMGITTLNEGSDHYGLSLVLGSGEVKLDEMVNAYSAFPVNGNRRPQTPILKATDSTGKVLEDNAPEKVKPKQVLDPQIAYIISNVLSDNKSRAYIFGINNPLTLPNKVVAAKTGTTEHFNDAWTMGFTKRLTTGVWVGNNDNAPMSTEAVDIAAPIWHDYMVAATANDPSEQFDRPSGVKDVTLDANTGKAPGPGTRQTRTDIFPSWYQLPTASSNQAATIDIVSGKLATACTPQDARRDITGALITAEIPPTDAAYPRWNPPVQGLAASLGYGSGGSIPTQNDDVHQCGDAQPTASISATANANGTVSVTTTVASGRFPISHVDVFRDNTLISSTGSGGTITDTPGSGTHSYYAKVYDAGYYNAQSNSVSVNVGGGGSLTLNCIIPKTCTLSGFSSGTATLIISGGGSYPDSSSPYAWSGWAGPAWNGISGAGSNVRVSAGGDTVYP